MLLLLVLGKLEVLVVLVVLKELVVFVGGIFERVESPNFLAQKKDLKILKTKSKMHLHFRVLHSIIPLVQYIPQFAVWPKLCSTIISVQYIQQCAELPKVCSTS